MLEALLRQTEAMQKDDVPLEAYHVSPKSPRNVLHLFLVSDFTALVLGFVFAWLLSAAVNTVIFARTDLNVPTSAYVVLALQFGALSAGVLLWFVRTSHYQTRIPFWMETRKIVEAGGFAMLIDCFLQVVSKEDFSRIWLLSAWLFSIVGIIAFRALVRTILQRLKFWTIPTVIIGNGRAAAETRAVLGSEVNLGYDFVAQIRDLPVAFKQAGSSWKKLCQSYKADYVVVALDGEDFVHAGHALAQLARERVGFSVVPPTHNLSVVGLTAQVFLGRDIMLMVHNNGLDYPLPRFLKRSFDILVSVTALAIASPIILLLAGIVKMDGGKAFYRHKRIGLNGEVFSCLKLRSMIANSDEVLTKHLETNPGARAEWLRDYKLRNDPRVTRIGAFMRRTSLDELPQLVNVLRGEMSVVGPRPIIVAEMAEYDSDIAFYYRVRPGITGLWQVSGRNDVIYAERVRIDSWYVRNWSLWHDIAIMCKTVSVVFKGRGAY